jgi:hypothetical protein
VKLFFKIALPFFFLLSLHAFSQDNGDTSIAKIKVKAKCRCAVEKEDSAGTNTILIHLKLGKGLSVGDFTCHGFKMIRDSASVACLNDSAQTDYKFENVRTGRYYFLFYADGYYNISLMREIAADKKSFTDETDFVLKMEQLPLWMQKSIRENRKKR